MAGPPGFSYQVSALAVSGSNVYARASFTTAGGTAANGIAKWNGSKSPATDKADLRATNHGAPAMKRLSVASHRGGTAGRATEPSALSGCFLDEFSEDAAPMPLTLVIAKGADDMEQDATETKLSEMSLHKNSSLAFQVLVF